MMCNIMRGLDKSVILILIPIQEEHVSFSKELKTKGQRLKVANGSRDGTKIGHSAHDVCSSHLVLIQMSFFAS